MFFTVLKVLKNIYNTVLNILNRKINLGEKIITTFSFKK